MEWGTEHVVHLPRLVHLFKQFCKYYTIQPATQDAILEILASPTVAGLLELPEQEWSSVLVNDLYKAGMHKTYATYFSGVSADFALQVRRSPVTLACMARQRPKLFQALQERVSALQRVQPYSLEVQRVLSQYAEGFTCTQEMLDRASKQGVAPVSWQAGHLPSGELADVCIASGPIESASHAETTVLQLVQAAIIRFQVEELREQHGLSRTSNGYWSKPTASAHPSQPHGSAAAHAPLHPPLQPSLAKDKGVQAASGSRPPKGEGFGGGDVGSGVQEDACSPGSGGGHGPASGFGLVGANITEIVDGGGDGGVCMGEEDGEVVPAAHVPGKSQAAGNEPVGIMQYAHCHDPMLVHASNTITSGGAQDAREAACASKGASASSKARPEQPLQQRGGASAAHGGRDPGWSFDLEGGASWWLDRSELLANSLAHLALVVDGLNSRNHGFELALFAGRRSSDRLFLILQALVFARLVKGYVGTSSLFVATLLDKVWDRVGMPLGARKAQLGRLVGTHAHEQSMLVQQLLAGFDHQAGHVARLHGSGPINVTALVAHLLYFAANGNLTNATALPDTFGTTAFVAVSMEADVPQAFSQHMAQVHGEMIPDDAKCFDLFRVWRIDSGNYEQTAEHILKAWEERCRLLAAAGRPCNPIPQFINSDLKDVDQILKLAELPAHLRPKMMAFGSLADGFLPFPKPPHSPNPQQLSEDDHQELEQQKQQHKKQQAAYPSSTMSVGISLGSIVMKAVQGYVCGKHSLQASALKLGDDPKEGKLILDPRMPPEERPDLVTMAREMAGVRAGDVNGPNVSKVVADAYEAGASKFK